MIDSMIFLIAFLYMVISAKDYLMAKNSIKKYVGLGVTFILTVGSLILMNI